MIKEKPLSREEHELWLLLEAQGGAQELLEFIPQLTPKYEAPLHLRPLAEVLARTWREPVRACTSVPPRHGKTETILHFIARTLLLHPDWLIGYVSYSTEFAEGKSRTARDLARRAGVKLRDDAHRLGEWRTKEGGGLLATGIGGPLTGHGCQILIIDDPVKNREEAESALTRESNWTWFTSTAASRLEPTGSIIVNMTRWHPDDLIGRIQAESEEKWDCVNLQAIDDATGEALWSTRWPKEVLEKRRRLVGEFDWAALYQGLPRPKGSRLFSEPTRYEFPDLNNARFVIAVDPAATEKTSADYSVAVVACAVGSGLEQRMYVLDVYRAQVEIPKLVQKLSELQKKWQAPVAIEAVAGFKAVPQMLRDIDPSVRIIPVEAKGDKFTRALPVAAAWADKRVLIPAYAAWVPDFVAEVMSFTGIKDRRDDQVDALSHAWTILNRNKAPIRRGVQIASHLPFG